MLLTATAGSCSPIVSAMAVQSKPLAPPGGLAHWLTTHPAGKPSILGLILFLFLARKRLASLAPKAVQRRPALSDAEMDHALEEVYVPGQGESKGSYELLVPHRGRISRVRVNPTKQSTFDAHFRDFEKLPPLAVGGGGGSKKKKRDGSADSTNNGGNGGGTKEDAVERKRQEVEAVRAQGGAAAASAKRVGVNKEFFRQLRALFKIMVPRSNAKEV